MEEYPGPRSYCPAYSVHQEIKIFDQNYIATDLSQDIANDNPTLSRAPADSDVELLDHGGDDEAESDQAALLL